MLAVIVLGALIAGAFALANFLGAGTAPEAAGQAGAGSSATAKPAANPVAKPGTPASAVCDEAGIKVSGAVDKTSYPAGEDPKLTLRVTNTGNAPCDINVGTSQMEFKITSGEDAVFSSKDCQADSTNLVKNLLPGTSETANFTWKRNRSAPGCAKVEAQPGGGGATYVFVATLGKWSSTKVVFELQ